MEVRSSPYYGKRQIGERGITMLIWLHFFLLNTLNIFFFYIVFTTTVFLRFNTPAYASNVGVFFKSLLVCIINNIMHYSCHLLDKEQIVAVQIILNSFYTLFNQISFYVWYYKNYSDTYELSLVFYTSVQTIPNQEFRSYRF